MVRIVAPNALVVAGPNFSASSQNTTKIPRGALENGTKPTFTASGIGQILQNQGWHREQEPPGAFSRPRSGSVKSAFGHGRGRRHYGLSAAMLPSAGVSAGPHRTTS